MHAWGSAHSGTGSQEVNVPSIFPPPPCPPPSFPSFFLPLPSHVQHLTVHKACSHPLFQWFLIRSCTSSILQMKKLRHRKEKRSKSPSRHFLMIQFYIILLSICPPLFSTHTPPTQLASCIDFQFIQAGGGGLSSRASSSPGPQGQPTTLVSAQQITKCTCWMESGILVKGVITFSNTQRKFNCTELTIP